VDEKWKGSKGGTTGKTGKICQGNKSKEARNHLHFRRVLEKKSIQLLKKETWELRKGGEIKKGGKVFGVLSLGAKKTGKGEKKEGL